MNRKFHKPIMIVLAIAVIYIGFNFKQLFVAPFFRSAIVNNTIDPTSVIFRNERFNGLIMCGEFNSKNRMGAYTGFERFISNFNNAKIPSVVSILSKDGDVSSQLLFQMKLSMLIGKDKEIYIDNLDKFRDQLPTIYEDKYDLEKANEDTRREEFNIYWDSICLN